MKLVELFLAVLAVSSFTKIAALKSYRNHKAVSFQIDNESQLLEIQSLENQSGVSGDNFMFCNIFVHLKSMIINKKLNNYNSNLRLSSWIQQCVCI